VNLGSRGVGRRLLLCFGETASVVLVTLRDDIGVIGVGGSGSGSVSGVVMTIVSDRRGGRVSG